MTIKEVKDVMRLLHRVSVIVFPTTLVKLSEVHYMFDNSGDIVNKETVSKYGLSDCFTFIDDNMYLNKDIQCMLFDDKSFDENEIEFTFLGCSALVRSYEDNLNLWEFHQAELDNL